VTRSASRTLYVNLTVAQRAKLDELAAASGMTLRAYVVSALGLEDGADTLLARVERLERRAP
jgi:hypothetical protein